MNIALIVAYAANRVIGKDNDLVWDLPDDMKYFMDTTRGHHVVMGRKNWESIPEKFRPLRNRTNIVLTHNPQFSIANDSVFVLNNLENAVDIARNNGESELFIIGGAQVYEQSMKIVDTMYITEVNAEPDGDAFFPDWQAENWKEISRKHHPSDERHAYSFDFVVYKRR